MDILLKREMTPIAIFGNETGAITTYPTATGRIIKEYYEKFVLISSTT